MDAPVIFCHYGNSNYLRYVFDAITFTNPDKKVILLGDETNQWLGERKGVQHFPFADMNRGEETERFNDVYRLVQGSEHGHMKNGKDWVNFVFKRWFYVYNFLQENGYERFWHFDSDNMILDRLADHESKYESYDCTEQCNGTCMNGFVSSPSVVRQYLNTINRLFEDREYLDGLKKHFQDETPGHAFTEMTAYRAYQNDVHTIRLNEIIGNSTFDDCICHDHGMTMEQFPSGKWIKKIHTDGEGKFFCQPKNSDAFVRLNSINLSWVPVGLFSVVLTNLCQPKPKSGNHPDGVKGADWPTLTEHFKQHFPAKTLLMRAKRTWRSLGKRR